MRYTLIVIFFLTNFFFSFGQETNVEPFKVLKGHKHKVQGVFLSTNGKYRIAGAPESELLAWRLSELKKREV